MKTIGLIGGMSWESTQHYYQLMNQYVHAKLGKHNSIEALIYSVNFERILAWVHQNQWESVGQEMAYLAQKLEGAGAHFLILTSNAIHKVFSSVEAAVNIPVIHIVDPTAEAILKEKMNKVGLLGTKVTLEEPFYKGRLYEQYGIETLIPEEKDRNSLHNIIFEELTVGKIQHTSRAKVLAMIDQLKERGAKGVILGCTELTLLLTQKDSPILLFDTTDLHARAAVNLSLQCN